MTERAAALLACAASAACGRFGFDVVGVEPTGDARTGDSDAMDAAPLDAPMVTDLPCNTSILLATLPTLTPDLAGTAWIATTATPRGLVVTFSSNGLKGLAIDLVAAPALGPIIDLGAQLTGNLTVTATTDRLFVSTGDQTNTLRVVVRDHALGMITATTVPTVTSYAPHHSAPAAGGGITVVGAVTNTLERATLDRNGATTAMVQAPLAGVTFPMLCRTHRATTRSPTTTPRTAASSASSAGTSRWARRRRCRPQPVATCARRHCRRASSASPASARTAARSLPSTTRPPRRSRRSASSHRRRSRRRDPPRMPTGCGPPIRRP